MRNKQEMSLMFMLRKDKISKKTGCAPLSCRIFISGNEADMSTRIKIPYDHWDQQTKKLLESCPDFQALQTDIADFTGDMYAYFNVLKLEHPHVTPEMVKNKYENKTVIIAEPEKQKPAGITVLEISDMFIREFEARTKLSDPEEKRSPQTLRQWKATRHKLIEYLTYTKTNTVEIIDKKTYRSPVEWDSYVNDGKKYDIPLADVTQSFYLNFRSYLTLKRHKKLGGLAADKQIKNTKQLFTYAVDREYLVRNPLRRFKCTAKLKKVIPLDYWEIETIINKTGLDKVMTETQECFIAMIFSGFAYQDIKGLGPDNIVQDPISGELFLRKDRGKTKIEEMVPILPPLMNLIRKYQEHPYCIKHNVLFPIKSNTGFNKYLKVLMNLCGIRKVLKTHLARHTFAFLMISFNVQLIILSKMMGHASIRSTERYFDVSMEMIAQAMKRPKNQMFDKMGKLKIVRRVIAMFTQHEKEIAA